MALLNALLCRILEPQVQPMNIRILSLLCLETNKCRGSFCRVKTARRLKLSRLILLGLLGLLVGCEPASQSPPTSEPSSAAVQPASPLTTSEQGGGQPVANTPSTDQAAEQVVRVRIRRGPGSDTIEGTVQWTQGLTVFDALSGVSPPIAVESTGQGESLFVQSIAGQANLGSAGDNWIYRVNGQLGDRSSGIYELEAGDQIEWSFGKYE
jgi:hypothetical protein